MRLQGRLQAPRSWALTLIALHRGVGRRSRRTAKRSRQRHRPDGLALLAALASCNQAPPPPIVAFFSAGCGRW